MAVTQLADLQIVPSIFTANVLLEMLELNAFIKSGVVVQDPEIQEFLNSSLGGRTYNPRFFEPLKADDPNVSTDNPDTKSVPKKISAILNTAVRQSLNNSWSSMDLNVSLNGADPLIAVTSQVAKYWNTVSQIRTLQSLQGVILGNIADNGGDMVVDITGESLAVDQYFNPDAFIDAQTTMGDRQADLTAIAVHSTVLASMRKQELVETIKPTDGTAPIFYYGNLPIIVDDAMTVEEKTTGSGETAVTFKQYYSYLFGTGAVAMGFGSPKVPFATDRDEDAGNGGGQETLYSRVEMILHPQGFQYNKSDNPTATDLKTAANWTRAFDRKRVPLACLISKG